MTRLFWRLSPLFLMILLAACGNLSGDVEIVATLTPIAPIATEPFQLPATAPNLTNGAAIFQENCTRCHGTNGAGNGELVVSGQVPRMPSFLEASHVRQQSLEYYYNTITNGNIINLMPPWSGELSVQERWDVAAYVYTLNYTPELLERGQELAQTGDTSLRIESDADLAAATRFSGDDAYAVVAAQRMQYFVITSLVEATEAPTASFTSINFSGTITHGTAGKTVPLGLTVQLRYGNSPQTMQLVDAVVDSNNHFVFNEIPYDPSFQYFAAVTYQERGFISQILNSTSIQADNELAITLYDIVSERSAVNMTEMAFQIDALNVPSLGDGLVINQINTYFNRTDRMFLVKPDSSNIWVSLLMQLPVGATILNNPNDPRYIQAARQYALIDLQPVYPGEHSITASYFVPYTNELTIDIPTNNHFEGPVNIFVQVPGLEIISDSLTLVEENNIGTEENPQIIRHYSGNMTLEVGQSLIFDISGAVPVESNNSNPTVVGQGQLLPIALIIGIVVLLLGIGLFFGLRARAVSPQARINRLLSQITQLEDLHKAGRINHDAYQNQVQTLKAELARLMAEQKQA